MVDVSASSSPMYVDTSRLEHSTNRQYQSMTEKYTTRHETESIQEILRAYEAEHCRAMDALKEWDKHLFRTKEIVEALDTLNEFSKEWNEKVLQARKIVVELNAQNEHLLSRCKEADVKERRQRARIEELQAEVRDTMDCNARLENIKGKEESTTDSLQDAKMPGKDISTKELEEEVKKLRADVKKTTKYYKTNNMKLRRELDKCQELKMCFACWLCKAREIKRKEELIGEEQRARDSTSELGQQHASQDSLLRVHED